jgi:glycosyltransferase involved in cell wall biosynthesis
MTTALVRLPKGSGLVYHCVDDVSAQPDMPSTEIGRFEEQLVRRADVVFVTSRALRDRWQRLRTVVYEPNCVDADHFRGAAPLQRGDLLSDVPHPRLIFAGAVAAYKMDVPLLIQLLHDRPGWRLIVIGPRQDNDAGVDRLLRMANVTYLGAKPYSELPGYLHAADVGLIPAALNTYTESMFPMKFFEYLAAGLPVVSTPLSSLEDFSNVASLAPAERFCEAVDSVLQGNVPPLADRLRVAEEHTYAARTTRMLQHIAQVGLP